MYQLTQRSSRRHHTGDLYARDTESRYPPTSTDIYQLTKCSCHRHPYAGVADRRNPPLKTNLPSVTAAHIRQGLPMHAIQTVGISYQSTHQLTLKQLQTSAKKSLCRRGTSTLLRKQRLQTSDRRYLHRRCRK